MTQQRTEERCRLCGHSAADHEPRGLAGSVTINDRVIRLCHEDTHSCYHLWTVYGERPHDWTCADGSTARDVVPSLEAAGNLPSGINAFSLERLKVLESAHGIGTRQELAAVIHAGYCDCGTYEITELDNADAAIAAGWRKSAALPLGAAGAR